MSVTAYQAWLNQVPGAVCAHRNPRGQCIECGTSLRTAVAPTPVVRQTRAQWDAYFSHLASEATAGMSPAPPDLSERIRAARVAEANGIDAKARQAVAFELQPLASPGTVRPTTAASTIQVASEAIPEAPDLRGAK
jgi:hypothetical protein